MTTLVMAAILIFGIMAYRQLPVSDLPNVDFPTIQVTRDAARREPGDHGLGGGHAAREAVLDHRRHRLDDLDERARRDSDHASSSRSTATSTPPPRTCRRPSPRPRRSCRRTCRRRRRYRKVNPADQPILYLALSSPTLPLYTVDEYAADDPGPAHLDGQRRRPGAGLRLAEVRGARPARSAARWPRAASASTRSQHGGRATATSTCRPARSTGTHQAFTVQATGQLTDAAAYRPLIVAYRNGAPVRLEELGRVIDSVENDKVASWFNDERGDRARRSSASPAPTPSRSSTRSASCCRRFRAAAAGRGRTWTSLYDRSVAIRESVARRAVHAAADPRASWCW